MSKSKRKFNALLDINHFFSKRITYGECYFNYTKLSSRNFIVSGHNIKVEFTSSFTCRIRGWLGKPEKSAKELWLTLVAEKKKLVSNPLVTAVPCYVDVDKRKKSALVTVKVEKQVESKDKSLINLNDTFILIHEYLAFQYGETFDGFSKIEYKKPKDFTRRNLALLVEYSIELFISCIRANLITKEHILKMIPVHLLVEINKLFPELEYLNSISETELKSRLVLLQEKLPAPLCRIINNY